jgi:type IV pilus assembly protein PilC
MNFAVPSFEKLYATFHVPLPLLTRILLNISRTLQKNTLSFLAIVIALVISLMLNKKYSIFKINFQAILLKIPYLKKLIHLNVMHYWCYSISEMTKSGLPLLNALSLAEKSNNYSIYRKNFHLASDLLQKGDLLYMALKKTNLFSADILGLIQIAEKSGNLTEMLAEVARQYYTKLNECAEKLNRLIEPLLTLVIALIIGTLVIALYWPMFNLGELF